MKPSVHIPKVDRDERIGSVFNELFRVVNATESAGEEGVVWDFSNASFFHPFFLAPLAIYKCKLEREVVCCNMSQYLSDYFRLIHFEDILSIGWGEDLRALLTPYIKKTYMPICKFPLAERKAVDDIQPILQGLIKEQSNYGKDIHTPLSYMLGELICNISEHSKSEYGYIYSQLSRHDTCINLCIADNGITVYGSYVAANRYTDKFNGEAEALRLANCGYSAKGEKERGFGLSSTRRMLVEGLNGSFFMLSGGAFYRYEAGEENYIELPPSIYWSGTIILLKIPVNIDEGFNIYDYLD